MGSAGKSRKTGSKCRGAKVNKLGVRKAFRARHIDQVWEDVRKEGGVHDGKTGPLGTTDKAELDEDVAGLGQHFCVPCSRYFTTQAALCTHQKSKPHKRRVKALSGDRPHNQADAEWAAGVGTPDNGPAVGGATAAMQL